MFHSVRLTFGKNWTIPTLDVFYGISNSRERKSHQYGKINRYKVHSLSMHEGTHNRKQRSKSEDKGKAHEIKTIKGTRNPSTTPLDQKLNMKGCVQEV